MNQSPSQNTSQTTSTATYVSALRIESVRSNAGAFLDHPMFMFLAEQLYAMEEQYQNLCRDHYDALRLCDSYRDDLHRANERIVLERSRVDELEMSWEMLFDQYNDKFDDYQELCDQVSSLSRTFRVNPRRILAGDVQSYMFSLQESLRPNRQEYLRNLGVIDLTTESDSDDQILFESELE